MLALLCRSHRTYSDHKCAASAKKDVRVVKVRLPDIPTAFLCARLRSCVCAIPRVCSLFVIECSLTSLPLVRVRPAVSHVFGLHPLHRHG